MARVRCPHCDETFDTQRGVITTHHVNTNPSTPEQIRLARESLAAADYDVPLPFAVIDAGVPDWFADIGDQTRIEDIVSALLGDSDG